MISAAVCEAVVQCELVDRQLRCKSAKTYIFAQGLELVLLQIAALPNLFNPVV